MVLKFLFPCGVDLEAVGGVTATGADTRPGSSLSTAWWPPAAWDAARAWPVPGEANRSRAGGLGRAQASGPPPPLCCLFSSSRAAAGSVCCRPQDGEVSGPPPPGKCLAFRPRLRRSPLLRPAPTHRRRTPGPLRDGAAWSAAARGLGVGAGSRRTPARVGPSRGCFCSPARVLGPAWWGARFRGAPPSWCCAPLLVLPMLQEGRFLALISRRHGG